MRSSERGSRGDRRDNRPVRDQWTPVAITGRAIPTGSLVVVAPWLLHRHRRLWDQPDAFIPDRFLAENAGSRERYSYIPFSIGPRVCAGAAFGFTEAILCIATLAQRARLKLEPDAVVEPVCRLTLRPSDDSLPMLLMHRGPQAAGAVAASTSAADVAVNPVS